MENKTKIIILISLLLFQIPVIMGSIYLHEHVHKWDFKDIPKTDESFCVGFDCGEGLLGSYSFNFDDTSELVKQYQDIKQYSEYKAYGVQGLFLIGYLLLIVYFIIRFRH